MKGRCSQEYMSEEDIVIRWVSFTLPVPLDDGLRYAGKHSGLDMSHPQSNVAGYYWYEDGACIPESI